MLTKRVLIAEDDPSLSAYWEYVFVRRGFTVDLAANVSSAINQYTQHPSHLLLLDYHLPDGTGLDIAKYIHTQSNHPPNATILVSSDVFLFSCHPPPYVDAFYLKPFTREEISIMLATHLPV